MVSNDDDGDDDNLTSMWPSQKRRDKPVFKAAVDRDEIGEEDLGLMWPSQAQKAPEPKSSLAMVRKKMAELEDEDDNEDD